MEFVNTRENPVYSKLLYDQLFSLRLVTSFSLGDKRDKGTQTIQRLSIVDKEYIQLSTIFFFK